MKVSRNVRFYRVTGNWTNQLSLPLSSPTLWTSVSIGFNCCAAADGCKQSSFICPCSSRVSRLTWLLLSVNCACVRCFFLCQGMERPVISRSFKTRPVPPDIANSWVDSVANLWSPVMVKWEMYDAGPVSSASIFIEKDWVKLSS